MPNHRRKKNRSKKQKKKQQHNKNKTNQVSEFFQIFLELNKLFLPHVKTGQINLKAYFQKNTYSKVNVIPTKFLRYWEWSQNSTETTDKELSYKFVEFMEELRPNSVEGFNSIIMLDDHRFKINGKKK